MVEIKLIDELISSCHIGLCFYDKKVPNNYLTGFSSEKLARYYKCGLPIISMNYPTFMKSVEGNKAGVCINNIKNLPGAVLKIESEYSTYSENAVKAYSKTFEFKNNFNKDISPFLKKLAN